jgi:hypothetical protein
MIAKLGKYEKPEQQGCLTEMRSNSVSCYSVQCEEVKCKSSWGWQEVNILHLPPLDIEFGRAAREGCIPGTDLASETPYMSGAGCWC